MKKNILANFKLSELKLCLFFYFFTISHSIKRVQLRKQLVFCWVSLVVDLIGCFPVHPSHYDPTYVLQKFCSSFTRRKLLRENSSSPMVGMKNVQTENVEFIKMSKVFLHHFKETVSRDFFSFWKTHLGPDWHSKTMLRIVRFRKFIRMLGSKNSTIRCVRQRGVLCFAEMILFAKLF